MSLTGPLSPSFSLCAVFIMHMEKPSSSKRSKSQNVTARAFTDPSPRATHGTGKLVNNSYKRVTVCVLKTSRVSMIGWVVVCFVDSDSLTENVSFSQLFPTSPRLTNTYLMEKFNQMADPVFKPPTLTPHLHQVLK